MDQHGDDRQNRGDMRHDGGGSERRGGRDGRPDECCGGQEGRGGHADTQFLQLEISQVLYSEAVDVARPAFRELLHEAAKEQLRARFGSRIDALAELAIDEFLSEIQSSLEIEARIQRHQEERVPVQDRLKELFGSGAGAPKREEGDKRGSRREGRKRR